MSKFKIVLALGAIGCAAHPTASGPEAPILSIMRHYGESSLHHVRLDGSGGGASYSLSVSRGSGRITFDINISGERTTVHFNEGDYPNMDFHSIYEGIQVYDGSPVFTFDIRYGPSNYCFMGDDGRRRLNISVNGSGDVTASRFDPEGCRANTYDVALQRVGPRLYSDQVP